MAVKAVEEVVIPWKQSQKYDDAIAPLSPSPLGKWGAFYAVPVLLLAMPMFYSAVPLWAKVVDGMLIAGWLGFTALRAKEGQATPAYCERAGMVRMLKESPEHRGAYDCFQGACDELKWVLEEKLPAKPGPDGKPVVLVRRTYPSVEFVVEMDTVRRILAWQPNPDMPHLTPPNLGQELRLRFDTTKLGMDSVKLTKGAPVLVSKLGLNDYQDSIDLTRGQTRHVDVRIAKFPEGDLYARFGRK